MKKALLVFVILFIITLLVPLIAVFQAEKDTATTQTTTGTNELVTIFNASIHAQNCRLHF